MVLYNIICLTRGAASVISIFHLSQLSVFKYLADLLIMQSSHILTGVS